MEDDFVEGNFLGLPEPVGPADVIIASVPYELTTSFGQGTANGPAACIIASGQVELFDDLLDEELPADASIQTIEPWNGEGNTLQEQLDGIGEYAREQYDTGAFPIFLGGEHGILPGKWTTAMAHAENQEEKYCSATSRRGNQRNTSLPLRLGEHRI